MTKSKIIVIAGPTASGKTKTAISVAQLYDTEIISFDSRQVYEELNIGVAKPTEIELSQIKHHLIGTHSIHQSLNVNLFAELVESVVNSRNQNYVLVGGSTLYLQSILYKLDEIPNASQELRAELSEKFAEKGLPWLITEVGKIDHITIASNNGDNPARLMRALEVYMTTGQTISSYKTGNRQSRFPNHEIIVYAIDIQRNKLYENINLRCDQMLADGLVAEVVDLVQFRHLPALNTVGYVEFFGYIDHNYDLDFATALFKQHTRNYAKRQLTWFRNQLDAKWLSPDEIITDFKSII